MLKIVVVLLALSLVSLGVGASDLAASHPDLHAVAIAGVAAEIEPLFVSVVTAAGILATSRSEIYQRVARGELDAVKDGGRLKITVESVKRYAASRPKATIKLYVPRR